MDLIEKFMNVVVSAVSLIAIFFFLVHYRFFKFLFSTVRTVFEENVTGKVVLITGASSGIGEYLAYEYARRGARLALVARREQRLQEVAAICEIIGSPEAVYILADVSKIGDCKRFVDATVNHFGHLDHLVTNAGVSPVCLFEEYDDITKASPAMDTNFWGSVYSSYFAQRHLKKSKGKIIVIASSTAWLITPRMSFYNASKAALVSFYETLRVEFGIQIGITIVTPGLIKTEMTEGKFLTKEGKLEVDQEMRDEIVDSALHGEKYLTETSWPKATMIWKVFCPEVMDWWINLLLMPGPVSSPRDAPSKKMTDLARGIKELFAPYWSLLSKNPPECPRNKI
ncbi:hypothetical protein DITRI_Ditri07aG0041000 [Diplodiscus trichospermus]